MRETLDVASRFSFWMYECNLEHVFILKGQIIHDIMSDSELEACLHGCGERRGKRVTESRVAEWGSFPYVHEK